MSRSEPQPVWVGFAMIGALALVLGVPMTLAALDTEPEVVIETSPVCPEPEATQVRVVHSDLIKDCLFSDPCAFRSRFAVEEDLRALRTEMSFREFREGR